MLHDDRYRGEIQRQAEVFAHLLDEAELSLPVPSCPGWALLDLAVHLGGVHRWAAHAATHDEPNDDPDPVLAAADAAAWYRESATMLHQALAADADSPCWTFGPPRTVRFWLRRQTHELTMHRVDADLAVGAPIAVDTEIALDGIAEVLELFLPRQVRLDRMPPLEAAVELQPVEGPRVLLGDPGSARGVVGSVRGRAQDLLALLWRRIGLDDPCLTIESTDPVHLDLVIRASLTP